MVVPLAQVPQLTESTTHQQCSYEIKEAVCERLPQPRNAAYEQAECHTMTSNWSGLPVSCIHVLSTIMELKLMVGKSFATFWHSWHMKGSSK